MKGLFCYYSNSGNTKLACEYIANKLNVPFDFYDIKSNWKINFDEYDIVGFACYADFGGPSFLMQKFIDNISRQKGKPAFVFNTFGFIGGRTLLLLKEWLEKMGFVVVNGFSLHTPENYPPILIKGITQKNAPSKVGLAKFNLFTEELKNYLKQIQNNEQIQPKKIKLRLVDSLSPLFPRTKAKEEMGEKSLNKITCTKCGLCAKVCGYGAIRLDPYPIFDESKCYGCWTCYNHCPTHSIYTAKIKDRAQYNKPNLELINKLKNRR